MFKLVALLATCMFLTLLIGGEDKGQMRQGLIGVDPEIRPAPRKVAAAPKAGAPDVKLANFAPATLQRPVPNTGRSAPIAGAFVKMQAAPPIIQDPPSLDPTPAPEALTVMYVSSTAVNVRGGPSTDYGVVGRLTRDEAVTVVTPATNGWVQIRIEGDGIDGYIAARLLTDIDPLN
jgi:hypothetical protein